MTFQQTFPSFVTLEVELLSNNVVHVAFNRPKKANSWNEQLWNEFIQCFEIINERTDINAVLLTGNGKNFSAGIDLQSLSKISGKRTSKCIARHALAFRRNVRHMQKASNLLALCPVPVICAIQGACYGMAIDVVSAADIRYCSKTAYFSIKEVDLAIIPDIGTCAYLPLIVSNHSLYRELLYSGRKFDSNEALQLGFVNRVLRNETELYSAALELCKEIAAKSPVAIRGIKDMCNFAMNGMKPSELQKVVGLINGNVVQGKDVMKAGAAFMMKRKPHFAKL